MKVVWINKINPIARGWFIRQNARPILKIKNIKNICKITGSSLGKILVLGTEEGVLLSLWSFKKNYSSKVYKTFIFIKLLKLKMLKLFWLLAILILFVLGVLVFISSRKHLLATLLSLEFIVLSLYIFLFRYLLNLGSELYFSMVFLTFAVCEGALGLSVLVSIIRSHGNDYFQSFRILQC